MKANKKTIASVKRPVGRPKKYNKAYADELAKTVATEFKNGEDIAEVCVSLGCSLETFYKMKEISPEFSKAVKEGLTLSEAWWLKLGRAGAAGQVKIQPVVWIFTMKNKFNWVDRQEVTGRDGESLFANFAQAVKENLDP